jgi:F-box and leucine-rich repeat protein GRR1
VGVGNFRELHVESSDDSFQPPINHLPAELLIAIFAKLSSPTDMLNCMMVCRAWATNCVGLLWHRPSCNTWDNLKRVTASVTDDRSYFQYSALIKRLNLSALSDKVNDGTAVSFAQCKRIERLTLTNCSMLTDTGVSSLVDGNRQLQALDVSDLKSLTDHTLFVVAQNCRRLQGLNITGCIRITDESLISLAESCRQLKRVCFPKPPLTSSTELQLTSSISSN